MFIPNIVNDKELENVLSADLWFTYFIDRERNLLFIWEDFNEQYDQNIWYYLCFKYPSNILENRVEHIKSEILQDWIQKDYSEYESAYFVVNFNLKNRIFVKIPVDLDELKKKIKEKGNIYL
jgi:hypothetical protein|nr:MAG TPA: hypothetical protein [Bacteriophage sp.]